MTNNEFINLIKKLAEVKGRICTYYLMEDDETREIATDTIINMLDDSIDLLIKDKFKELEC
jgi:hypothetical protein